jgi:D-alanyl-lipoteichoic acid acyltransferase DltB (MBOAT superfamily)
VLPLGISFYSFEAISYLLDTRQGRVKTASFSALLP